MDILSDDTYAVIREKREAKGKDKKRYQELKAEVQKKLRMDKQQQLEGMCSELEAANTKGNSRHVFNSDSQINDSKVSTTPAMYPVSNWRKFD